MIPKLSQVETVIFGVVFASLSLVGLLGNLLVIVSIATDRKMRSAMNLLLLNLACADLGNLVACATDWIQVMILRGPGWLLLDLLCPLSRYIPIVFLYASLLSQVAVSVER